MIRRSGFSLLEAVVALVLIAAVGMALFGWINTNLVSLGRVQDHTKRREAIYNALSFMEGVNPMETPSGKAGLGSYVIRWEARLAEPERSGDGGSLYLLGLYKTEVDITKDDGETVNLSLWQVGYKRVHQFETIQ